MSFAGRKKEYWVRDDYGAIIGRFATFDEAESVALSHQGSYNTNERELNFGVYFPVQILTVYTDPAEVL